MVEKISMTTKKEYINIQRKKYKQTYSKRVKQAIIDEVIQTLGYNRKYAITKLNQPLEVYVKKRTRKRKKIYTPDLKPALKTIWKILNKPCSKRLKEQLPEMVKVLIKFKEIQLKEGQEELLCQIGSWSIENLLREEKRKFNKGKSGTRPSRYYLNRKIKIRTDFDDIHEAGHLEIDTVHHCGDRLVGVYGVTLNSIDIETLWSEQECFLSNTKRHVISRFDLIRKRLPFNIKSTDFDNGGEFKNYMFINYCEKNNIEPSRSRSYRKNDQCYIEGNNYTDVRDLIGYSRYDTKAEIDLINDIYRNEHRLLNNYFYPNMKLVEKKRYGGKVVKLYDKAKTPYQRLLETNSLSQDKLNEQKHIYENLNPAKLKRDLDAKLHKLAKLLRLENYNKQHSP